MLWRGVIITGLKFQLSLHLRQRRHRNLQPHSSHGSPSRHNGAHFRAHHQAYRAGWQSGSIPPGHGSRVHQAFGGGAQRCTRRHGIPSLTGHHRVSSQLPISIPTRLTQLNSLANTYQSQGHATWWTSLSASDSAAHIWKPQGCCFTTSPVQRAPRSRPGISRPLYPHLPASS